ncbi:M28 family peptidase [Tunicatimonas pelagia]|uniref:M28 family peptidase n=1 Tax=Tunicatimonas pelagia TaxID=931531 RepID=UPI002666DED8|nr:M28 family peptidase [Tunicatimonas pelagia]WKN45089.1 M28 family peptidase [Tunicatimonas pelagia]
MKKFRQQYTIIGIIALLAACQPNQSETVATEPTGPRYVPNFNADSAYAYLKAQVDFGPRVPNSAAHRECRDYLVSKLEQFGAQVQLQSFEARAYDGTMLDLSNIIASYQPKKSKRILLAAHWDTRPYADKDSVRAEEPILGANDGASGVAVLLEMARVMSQDSLPDVGVDIIFFDGEDYGEPEDYDELQPENSQQVYWCLGSQYWAKNKHEPRYSAYYGILLDMVGAKNATFYREGVSRQAAPSIVKRIWDAGHQLGHGQYFIYKDSPDIVDDHVYVNYQAKIPMVNIIEHDPASEFYFARYHHTHADDMNIISRETLEAVGETVMYVVYQE